MKKKIGILGAGSWGITLSVLLNKKGFLVSSYDLKGQIKVLKERRESPKLPGLSIPREIELTSSLREAIQEAEILVFALPSHEVRGVARELAVALGDKAKISFIVSVVKGIENETGLRMSEVLIEELSPDFSQKIAALSGPSHAEEVSRQVPTTVVAASPNSETAKYIQDVFMTPYFRVYTSQDLIGVELGGSLKNIIAIAAGISDGLGFGDNTKAALLTRGLAEISRLGVAMGADSLTFAGLSGIGDLITTSISRYSRNRNLGEAMARGKSLKKALQELGMVAEGVRTTKSAQGLAKKFALDMPITAEVYSVLFEGKNPREVVLNLMQREAKPE
jgi:glycerol-3-phosphate dehydrogenase (NAD(P)+)